MNVTKQTVDLSLKHFLVHTHCSVLLLSAHGSSTPTLHSVLGSVNSPLTEKGMCSGREQGQVSYCQQRTRVHYADTCTNYK